MRQIWRAALFLSAIGLAGCGPFAVGAGLAELLKDDPGPGVKPEIIIEQVPGEFDNTTTPVFAFSVAKKGVRLSVEVDGVVYDDIVSPFTLPDELEAGKSHVAILRADDGSQVDETTPIVWTIDLVPPDLPTGVVASATEPRNLRVTWEASDDELAGIDRYVVHFRLDPSSPALAAVDSGMVDREETFADLSDLRPGSIYQIEVEAIDAAGNSSGRTPVVGARTRAGGDGSFSAPQWVEAGGNVSAVRLADVNGDGLVDLVYTLRDEKRVAWRLTRLPDAETGAAVFGEEQSESTSAEPDTLEPMTASSLSGGYIAVGSSQGNSIDLFSILSGGESLALNGTIATANPVTSLAGNDLDRDGEPDLVYASERLHLNQVPIGGAIERRMRLGRTLSDPGNSLFASGSLVNSTAHAQTYVESYYNWAFERNEPTLICEPADPPTFEGARAVRTVDVTRDALRDVVWLSEGVVHVLGARTCFWQSYTPPFFSFLPLENLDADYWSPALGLGVTHSFESARTFDVGPGPRSLVVTDFTGDGHADVAVLRDGKLELLPNVGGSALFDNGGDSIDVGTANGEMEAGDFDEDGQTDLAIADPAAGAVQIVTRGATGEFITGRSFAAGSGPRSLAVGDLNADGITDLVVNQEGKAGLVVLLGSGTRAIPSGVFRYVGRLPVTGGVRSVVAGDLSSDLHADVAGLSVDPDAAISFAQLRFGPLIGASAQLNLDVIQGRRSQLDFTAVGLIVGPEINGLPSLLMNGREGTALFRGIKGKQGSARYVPVGLHAPIIDSTAVPVCGGGVRMQDRILGVSKDPFLAVPCWTTYEPPADESEEDNPDPEEFHGIRFVSISANGSLGDFGSLDALDTDVARTRVPLVAADFNLDGAADLALLDLSATGAKLRVRLRAFDYDEYGALQLQEGNDVVPKREFEETDEYDAGDDPRDLIAVNLNGDSFPDIVVITADDGGEALVFLGNDDGTFAKAVKYAIGDVPIAFVAGDFDDDLDQDLAILVRSDTQGPGVRVLLGDGSGKLSTDGGEFFAAHDGSESKWDVNSLAAADLDGDGVLDLVVGDADPETGGFRILRGSGTLAPDAVDLPSTLPVDPPPPDAEDDTDE